MPLQTEVPEDEAVICTICGDAGTGKTTLAATFPNPVFIQAEKGLNTIPRDVRPQAFPRINSADELWKQLTQLVKEEHDFKTVVIDSVTALETIFIEDVLKNDLNKPKSINQALGGYGNGFAAVGGMHRRVFKFADALRERRGINVVFVAHADTETIEPPDSAPYTRYALQLNKKYSSKPYINDVDLVGFLKMNVVVLEGKAHSDSEIVLVCHATAANVSKNRFGISEDLVVDKGKNPLYDHIPYLNQ